MFFWNSLAFSMISGCWQFDLCFLCLSKTSLNIREFTVLVKDKAFPVVIYGYESWTIKKVEHQRIDAFELWYWRRLLRVPWIARRSSQSLLKEISPEYSLEGLMLKLNLQSFGHLMQRTDSSENKYPDTGKD